MPLSFTSLIFANEVGIGVPTPATLVSGLAQIGLWVSLFLAPHLLQTRWLATSGTGMRFGSFRISD